MVRGVAVPSLGWSHAKMRPGPMLIDATRRVNNFSNAFVLRHTWLPLCNHNEHVDDGDNNDDDALSQQ